ncbi:hypothetical protein BG015_010941 [Linnemannia schmuckeri]|uniref:Arrestin-like N-terminal domain-containing protein n=1 Tax=Linnemannia schmuckeri TaxID=64567 RepID=A0A9P5V8J1_9FUNG|nr:hypothetical protein BG015_010941 [Linnemannia schmuckeri]
MVFSSSTEEWFSIQLDKPHIVLAGQHGPLPSAAATATSSPPTTPTTTQNLLTGTIAITLTKTMNVHKFNYSCDLIDKRIPILSTTPKEPRALPAGHYFFPFSIPLPDSLPSVLTTNSVNINYQLTASLQPVSFLPFAQPYQTTKPVIILRVNDIPDDSFYSPRQVQFASKRTDRVQGEARVLCRVLPNCETIPLDLHLNLRGNSTNVSKVAIELWERAFRLQEQLGGGISGSNDSDSPTTSRVQVDERRVSCQSCPVSGWPSCSSTGETIEVSKRLMFKVPRMPLEIWADEPDRLVSTDRRSSLPKGSCNISGVYSLVGIEIQHMLRVVVFVDGELTSESSTKTTFPVDDTAHGETRVHILGLQEQQPQSENEAELPSYHRSFTTMMVDEARLAEMDRRSFEALQGFELLMICSPSLDATAERVTVAAAPGLAEGSQVGDGTVTVTVEPPCYEESIRSSFTSSRGVVSAELTRGTSLDQRSLHDSLWDSNSGRPSTSADTYAQDLADYMERYSYATPLSNAS